MEGGGKHFIQNTRCLWFFLQAQSLQNSLTDSSRASRVLTGDQRTPQTGGLGDDDLLTPGLISLDVATARNLLQLGLQHEGHCVRELDLVLLGVGETGHGGTGDERNARGRGGVEEDAGTMADSCDGLFGGGEGLNEGERGGVCDEVEHGWNRKGKKWVKN